MSLIYIVEDDANIREIEEYVLKNAGYKVQSFETATDFLRGLKVALPGMILLDLMLPDEDGLTVLGRIRQRRETARIPVILVTAKSTEIDKVRGLDQGADDYITKPFGVMELLSRVKALMRRSYGLGEVSVHKSGEIRMDESRRAVYVGENLCELTFKEYELLKLFLKNPDRVVPREEIIRQVWGTEYLGESRTLDMHIRTLRKKLGEAGGRIHTIRNVGYIFQTLNEGKMDSQTEKGTYKDTHKAEILLGDADR